MAIALPELVKRTPPQVVEVPKKEEPKKVEPKKVEPKKVEVAQAEVAQVEEPKVEVATPRKVTPKRNSILDLGALLSQDSKRVEPSTSSDNVVVAESNIDPQAELKITNAKGAIMEFLNSWRPRFSAVFEPMNFSENAIKVVVPTPELRDEIERNKTELLTRVIELADIKGVIALEIEVKELAQSLKPIKLEDRIAYIMGLNPLIAELRDALDLDVEG